MKKYKIALCTLLLLLLNVSGADNIHQTYQIKSGTYELRGSNDSSGHLDYRGEVVILPQGDNYALMWKIGRSQTQVGVGILHKNILSVSYIDTSRGAAGVMSFQVVSEDELDGKWAGLNDTIYGREYLVWKN